MAEQAICKTNLGPPEDRAANTKAVLRQRILARSRVAKNGCWEWTQPTHGFGYGRMRHGDGTYSSASRVSLIAFADLDPNSPSLVLHECDKPACVNPGHLYVGTQGDNMHDRMARKGWHDTRGARHGMAKLTDADAREIKRALVGYKRRDGKVTALAQKYGVSHSVITRIREGSGWRHVDA